MTKRLYLSLLMAMIVALFSSCSKKMDELSADYFTVTPQVLEAVDGRAPATINDKFPEKYFSKKAVIGVTPVLKWNGGEAKDQPATSQGEEVEGNDQTISYKMGGNYAVKTSSDYVPEVAKSKLCLEFKATIDEKVVTIPAVKIVDGIISTSELVNNILGNANPALGEDAFRRITKEKHDANITFLVQQASTRSSELKTVREFNKEVANVNEAANKKINNIGVSAYASPDGDVSLNTTLAENRENSIIKLLSKDLKKAKIDAPIDARYTAQGWEGFQGLVSKPSIQDKELILRVIAVYQDPAQRENEIRNVSTVYKESANTILPQLRRSRLTLNYEIIGKSDEEITKLASSNPSKLNVEELLYIATLTSDPTKQGAIYTQTTKQFPNDYRGYNNLGKLVYQAGNVDKAESYFEKAANVNVTPGVNMNLGLVSLMKGNKTATEAYLDKAAGTEEPGESMSNLYITQDQYEGTVNSFGDSKANNAALAQILAKDYSKAKNTLINVERPNAYTDYLMVVSGARTNNSSMVTSGLRSAAAKDSSLAKKAVIDLEFTKYFTNVDFMNIVK